MKHHCTTETRVKWRIYKPISLTIHHKNWYYKLQNDIGVGTRGGHQGHVPPQVFINCYINCSPQSKSLSYATEWMCNEIPLSTCYIEKYHSFIVFDIATCALATMQIIKCSSYFPHIMSESQFSYNTVIVPTCIWLIHDTFLYSFVLWWYFNITF